MNDQGDHKLARSLRTRSILDAISLIAILAGILYGALELRQFRYEREREATFELVRFIQTPEFAAALTTVLALPDSATAEEILALPKEDVDRLYHLQSTWESLGILVYRRDVDLELVDEFYGGPIMITWRKLQPIVAYNRQAFRRESVNEWFQWLVERLEESYAGQPELPPAHRAFRDWKPDR